MAKLIKPIIEKTPLGKGKVLKPAKPINDKIFVPTQHAADIILTNTQVELKGTKIKIFGNSRNLLASFDSKTATFTVRKKLMVGSIDVSAKLKDLETRIQKLES